MAAARYQTISGVIPGPAEGRSRGIYNHYPGVWIPGSPLRGAPE